MADPVYIDVEIKHHTEKAILVEVEGEEHWIPVSQIIWDETEVAAKGDVGTMAITQWIAREKGLD
jgi:hypothetical protein